MEPRTAREGLTASDLQDQRQRWQLESIALAFVLSRSGPERSIQGVPTDEAGFVTDKIITVSGNRTRDTGERSITPSPGAIAALPALACCEGWESFVPAACGAPVGGLYVADASSIQVFRLPDEVYRCFSVS